MLNRSDVSHNQGAAAMATNDSTFYEDYDEYMYTGYTFEIPVYLYIWEVMVIITTLVNIIVISILLQKQMRSSTNIILAAISVSDTLTGLVTLPTYIMVFQRFERPPLQAPVNLTSRLGETNNLSSYDELNITFIGAHSDINMDGFNLTKELCNAFMISKYFLSKYFHTVTIFLTIFLGLQRYASMTLRCKKYSLFGKTKTTVCCICIFVISPVFHVYHLFDEKTTRGLCQWEFKENDCDAVCINMWVLFFIRQFAPCITLIVLTVLLLLKLKEQKRQLATMTDTTGQLVREKQRRNITLMVTLILIVFLIVEIPHEIFLLYNAFDKTFNEGKALDLETNRAIHMVYDLLLVVSFNANLYIYILFNKRFRKTFKETFNITIKRNSLTSSISVNTELRSSGARGREQ